MKGELGPLTQAVAKYQMERRIQKEMDKLKVMKEKLKKIQMENIKDQDVNKNSYILNFLILNNLYIFFIMNCYSFNHVV